MAYHIDFDSTNRILRARFEGTVTDDELKEVYRFGQENVTRFDPRSGITDFSGVTTVAFSSETMRDLARAYPETNARMRAEVLSFWLAYILTRPLGATVGEVTNCSPAKFWRLIWSCMNA